MRSTNMLGWLLLITLVGFLAGAFHGSAVCVFLAAINLLGLSATMAYASANSPHTLRRLNR